MALVSNLIMVGVMSKVEGRWGVVKAEEGVDIKVVDMAGGVHIFRMRSVWGGWEYRVKGGPLEGSGVLFWELGDGVVPGNRETRLVKHRDVVRGLKEYIKRRKEKYGE